MADISCDKHLERVLDAIPTGVTIIDRDGRITFANIAATKLFNVKRSEIIGRDFSDFEWKIVTKNGRRIAHEEHPLMKMLQTGEPVYEFEHVHEYPGGIRRIMLADAMPLYDEKGAFVGAVISHSDITARIKAAEEIRESRRQVLDILESITDGFFALDNDWRFTYLNRKAEQLLRKRKELLLFRNIWEALPDIVGTKSYEEFNRAKEEMVPISFEAFYPSLNKWLEIHVYPYENGLSVYLSDVTGRKRVEEELKESEGRYRSLVELSPDGIAVHSKGILIYVNPATIKMFGAADANELIGKPVLSFVHPDYREIVVERIKQMQQGKTVGLTEEKFVRVDGSPIDVEVAASPIIYDGKPAIQVVFRDITERKKAED